MEQWENDLRAELTAEFEEGEYKISEYPRMIKVDKSRFIDYLVGEEYKRRKLTEFYEQHKSTDKESEAYKKAHKELMSNLKTKTYEHKAS
jgi:hypothetical protein